MNYSRKKAEAVKNFLILLDESELLTICDDYVDNVGCERVFVNGDNFLDEIFRSPSDAVRAAIYGNYNVNDNYVTFDGYGNLESSDDLCDLIDFDELTDWVIRNEPNEISSDLEDALRDEFSELFVAEHPDADIEDNLYNYDIIGDDWNDLAAEIESELESDSDDDE